METNEMTLLQKDSIKELLLDYGKRYSSMNRAAESLKGVSAATISAIINNKYESISDMMWRNISAQIGGNNDGWQIVETPAFKDMMFALKDAQDWKNVTWVVGEAGCGKSTAASLYRKEHREVFVILCSEDMRKSDFVREMALQIGISTDGYCLRDVLDMVITRLSCMRSPLLIFDEGDKLTDTVFTYFISLYNRLEAKSGMAFFSTSYIKRRMAYGLQYNKKGYKEISSRIGRKFYDIEPTTEADVYAICKANGITTQEEVKKIIKDVASCDYDLRRAKKAIHKTKRIAATRH